MQFSTWLINNWCLPKSNSQIINKVIHYFITLNHLYVSIYLSVTLLSRSLFFESPAISESHSVPDSDGLVWLCWVMDSAASCTCWLLRKHQCRLHTLGACTGIAADQQGVLRSAPNQSPPSRARGNIGSKPQIEENQLARVHLMQKANSIDFSALISAINPHWSPLYWSRVIRRWRKQPKGDVARYQSMSKSPPPPVSKSRCAATRLVNGPRLHWSIFHPDGLDNCQGGFPSHCD